MEKRRLIDQVLHNLDPDKRPWMYDCDGNKVVQGDFTRPWTEEEEQTLEYELWLEKCGHDWKTDV